MGKTKYQPIAYTLRIHGKGPKYRYVDGTPTPAKIQISHFLKVGQFYIDVYIICNLWMILKALIYNKTVETPVYSKVRDAQTSIRRARLAVNFSSM